MSRHKSVMLVAILCLVATMSPTLDSHGQVISTFPRELEGTDEGVSAHLALEMVQTQFYENIGQIKNDEVKMYGMTSWGAIGFAENEIILFDRSIGRYSSVPLWGEHSTVPEGHGLTSNSTTYLLGGRGSFVHVSGYRSVVYGGLWPGMELIFYYGSEGISHELRTGEEVSLTDVEMKMSVFPRQLPRLDTMKAIAILEDALNDAGLSDYEEERHGLAEDSTNIPFLYSTFVGGSESDWGMDVTVDEWGNVYVAGTTESPDFQTESAMDPSFNGYLDCFVLKLNATGNRIVYSTFIGGSFLDIMYAIEVDSEGNVYGAGSTGSVDFPTKSAYSDSLKDWEANNCFVFKLNASGNGLVYSTYVGGSVFDSVFDIEIDPLSCVIAVGRTTSPDFPIVNAFDHTTDGLEEGFVFKLNVTGNGLSYSSFLGGSSPDGVMAVAVDLSGNAYLTGYTDSADFPVMNAIDDIHNGLGDCFISKLNSSGGLVYSTFVGGANYDIGSAVGIDEVGAVTVAGWTYSSDFPLINPFESQFGGECDSFVVRIDSNCSSILFSSFVGGSGIDIAESMTLDSNGNVYVTGFTNSTDFPMVAAYDSTYNGGQYDAFIFGINASGDRLLFSTFVGGSGADHAHSIELGPLGNILVTGGTDSGNFPLMHPIDGLYGGNRDCFVLSMRDLSDRDGDGLPDWWEAEYGLNPILADSHLDSDGDGLSNLEEYMLGINPTNNDTDRDGMPDGWEVEFRLDPLLNDSGANPDSDELTNVEEYLHGTHPNRSDTDSDGMPDGWEVLHDLNPVVDDATDDLDQDSLANMEEYQIGTHPNNNDTDSDGMPDGWEVRYGLDPLSSSSDGDSDLDDLSDLEEYLHGTDPFDKDSDADGIPDGWEVEWGYSPISPDLSLIELLHYNIVSVTLFVSPVMAILIAHLIKMKLEEKRKKQAELEKKNEEWNALEDLVSSIDQ